jgi:hypothetical protein
MKKLLATLLLSIISNHTIAAVGDIYSCKAKIIAHSEKGYETWDNKHLDNFSFKREKNEIIFEKYSSLSSANNLQITSSLDETFTAYGEYFVGINPTYKYLSYRNGLFVYSQHLFFKDERINVTSKIADCFISNLN